MDGQKTWEVIDDKQACMNTFHLVSNSSKTFTFFHSWIQHDCFCRHVHLPTIESKLFIAVYCWLCWHVANFLSTKINKIIPSFGLNRKCDAVLRNTRWKSFRGRTHPCTPIKHINRFAKCFCCYGLNQFVILPFCPIIMFPLLSVMGCESFTIWGVVIKGIKPQFSGIVHYSCGRGNVFILTCLDTAKHVPYKTRTIQLCPHPTLIKFLIPLACYETRNIDTN